MISITEFFMGIVSLLLLLYCYNHIFSKRPKAIGEQLPGPRGYPFLGNLLEIGKYPEKQFGKWRKQYGDMYQITVANFTNVVISDPKLVKEILSDPVSSGRMFPWAALYEDTPGLGLFASEGELWSVHRKFVMRQLREFGFGKSSMEILLMDEVKEVIKLWRQKAGTSVTGIRETMRLAVVNSFWSIIASQRFDLDDQALKDLSDNTSKKYDDVIARGAILLFIPWMQHVMPEWSGYNGLRSVFEVNKKFFEKSIEEHKKNFKDNEGNDFIDVYLAEMKKHEDNPSSQFYGKLAERQLTATIFDMFAAGSDTTAMSTAWAVLYLCKFLRVQKKLQEEISEITNGDIRHVSLSDRLNMPYAMAVVDEIYRFSSIAAFDVPHRIIEDTVFNGYFIPKNAQIIPNLYYIHHSPEIWGDPGNFRPERFLSEDGKTFVRNENLMPFSVGRRVCPGEQLARDNVFLYLTNLFQRFSMKFDPVKEEPDFEAQPGFLRAPFPFHVVMTDRMPKIME